MAYPATFDVHPPQEYDKAQVVLRVLILIVLSIFQISSLVFGGAYLIFPILAAVMVSQKGGATYLQDAEQGPTKWLRYLLMFYAYIGLGTDKFDTEKPEQVIQFNVRTTGEPTVGSALLRIILGIPQAFVLAIVGIAFFFVWLIAAASIVVNGNAPGWCQDFIRGYLRWNARLLAYMASLVDEYPPFSFENGDAAPAASAATLPGDPGPVPPPPSQPSVSPPAGSTPPDAPSSPTPTPGAGSGDAGGSGGDG
jgi:hypothetical protein